LGLPLLLLCKLFLSNLAATGTAALTDPSAPWHDKHGVCRCCCLLHKVLDRSGIKAAVQAAQHSTDVHSQAKVAKSPQIWNCL
jgi:hypothetical protein